MAHSGTEVDEFANTVSLGFLSNEYSASLVFGRGKPPFKLTITEFIPTNHEKLYFPTIVPALGDQKATFKNNYPRPLALRNFDGRDMQNNCRAYLECLVRHQRDVCQASLAADTSIICKRILRSIIQYQRAAYQSNIVSNMSLA